MQDQNPMAPNTDSDFGAQDDPITSPAPTPEPTMPEETAPVDPIEAPDSEQTEL
jgi:hypothetical protein